MVRYVGIDLAKRTMEVCVMDGEKIERHRLTTDEKGRKVPASLLRETDTAGYEVCRYGNRLARMLQKTAGCTVVALNPGDLRIIWKRRTCGPGNMYRPSASLETPPHRLPVYRFGLISATSRS
jgi:hypothetical protein